jgi:hypothetical protein
MGTGSLSGLPSHTAMSQSIFTRACLCHCGVRGSHCPHRIWGTGFQGKEWDGGNWENRKGLTTHWLPGPGAWRPNSVDGFLIASYSRPIKSESHTCNPNYLWDGDTRILVWVQPSQKSYQDPISKNKLGVVYHSYNPSYARSIGRIPVWGCPRQKILDLISKIT